MVVLVAYSNAMSFCGVFWQNSSVEHVMWEDKSYLEGGG
jgi:hypothetical protein